MSLVQQQPIHNSGLSAASPNANSASGTDVSLTMPTSYDPHPTLVVLSLAVGFIATGNRHTDRAPARLVLVNEGHQCILDTCIFVESSLPALGSNAPSAAAALQAAAASGAGQQVESCLTPLTDITLHEVLNAPSMTSVVARLRELFRGAVYHKQVIQRQRAANPSPSTGQPYTPQTPLPIVIVGRDIRYVLNLLGLSPREDYTHAIDVDEFFCYQDPLFYSHSYFDLHHIARMAEMYPPSSKGALVSSSASTERSTSPATQNRNADQVTITTTTTTTTRTASPDSKIPSGGGGTSATNPNTNSSSSIGVGAREESHLVMRLLQHYNVLKLYLRSGYYQPREYLLSSASSSVTASPGGSPSPLPRAGKASNTTTTTTVAAPSPNPTQHQTPELFLTPEDQKTHHALEHLIRLKLKALHTVPDPTLMEQHKYRYDGVCLSRIASCCSCNLKPMAGSKETSSSVPEVHIHQPQAQQQVQGHYQHEAQQRHVTGPHHHGQQQPQHPKFASMPQQAHHQQQQGEGTMNQQHLRPHQGGSNLSVGFPGIGIEHTASIGKTPPASTTGKTAGHHSATSIAPPMGTSSGAPTSTKTQVTFPGSQQQQQPRPDPQRGTTTQPQMAGPPKKHLGGKGQPVFSQHQQPGIAPPPRMTMEGPPGNLAGSKDNQKKPTGKAGSTNATPTVSVGQRTPSSSGGQQGIPPPHSMATGPIFPTQPTTGSNPALIPNWPAGAGIPPPGIYPGIPGRHVVIDPTATNSAPPPISPQQLMAAATAQYSGAGPGGVVGAPPPTTGSGGGTSTAATSFDASTQQALMHHQYLSLLQQQQQFLQAMSQFYVTQQTGQPTQPQPQQQPATSHTTATNSNNADNQDATPRGGSAVLSGGQRQGGDTMSSTSGSTNSLPDPRLPVGAHVTSFNSEALENLWGPFSGEVSRWGASGGGSGSHQSVGSPQGGGRQTPPIAQPGGTNTTTSSTSAGYSVLEGAVNLSVGHAASGSTTPTQPQPPGGVAKKE